MSENARELESDEYVDPIKFAAQFAASRPAGPVGLIGALIDRIAWMMVEQPGAIDRTLTLHCRRTRQGCCDCCSSGGFPVPYPCVPARTAMKAREIENHFRSGSANPRSSGAAGHSVE